MSGTLATKGLVNHEWHIGRWHAGHKVSFHSGLLATWSHSSSRILPVVFSRLLFFGRVSFQSYSSGVNLFDSVCIYFILSMWESVGDLVWYEAVGAEVEAETRAA